MAGTKTDSGKRLNKLWNVGARHALFLKDGNWYHWLKEFPGAYFDPNGYLLFDTEEDFLGCDSLDFGIDVHVKNRGSISGIQGYKPKPMRGSSNYP